MPRGERPTPPEARRAAGVEEGKRTEEEKRLTREMRDTYPSVANFLDEEVDSLMFYVRICEERLARAETDKERERSQLWLDPAREKLAEAKRARKYFEAGEVDGASRVISGKIGLDFLNLDSARRRKAPAKHLDRAKEDIVNRMRLLQELLKERSSGKA